MLFILLRYSCECTCAWIWMTHVKHNHHRMTTIESFVLVLDKRICNEWQWFRQTKTIFANFLKCWQYWVEPQSSFILVRFQGKVNRQQMHLLRCVWSILESLECWRWNGKLFRFSNINLTEIEHWLSSNQTPNSCFSKFNNGLISKSSRSKPQSRTRCWECFLCYCNLVFATMLLQNR